MNNFEKKIKSSKEQLDEVWNPPDMWTSIDQSLKKQKPSNWLKRNWGFISAAASIALILTLVLNNLGTKHSNSIALNADFKTYENIVAQKINYLKAKKIPVEQLEDYELLLKQLKVLDAQYETYLSKMDSQSYQPEVGREILNYYKTKILLLEKIQLAVEETLYYENKYETQSEKAALAL